MQESARRTARACERCRRTRRRCEPPYPCRQCVKAGAHCDVRDKARPQRLRRRRDATSPEGGKYKRPGSSREAAAQGDAFEMIRILVQDLLLERHGYSLNCELPEPEVCRDPRQEIPSLENVSRSSLSLEPMQLRRLLTECQRYMGWQEIGLLDAEDMYARACADFETLSGSVAGTSITALASARLSIDFIALLFAVLALGASAIGNTDQAQHYSDIATEQTRQSTGPPTLDLCLAYYFQHFYALRTATLGDAQDIIARAIALAHDLQLHEPSHGLRGLQLYLMIYMADQYCALTHSSLPRIRASQLNGATFAPLTHANPQLQVLVNLVMLNGHVIEHSHRDRTLSEAEVSKLEDRIGDLCLRQSVLERPACGTFRARYEPLARIHMLCCRIKLRLPGLISNTSWLPSLCVCLHAAQSVLATYLELYRSILLALVQTGSQKCYIAAPSIASAVKLPVTWRQVKRIVMSVFVIIYAYWHGEIVHGEALRFLAMARLLLEYPRWRWGNKLNEPIKVLLETSALANFTLIDSMKGLLPEASEDYLSRLCDPRNVESNEVDTSSNGHDVAFQDPPTNGNRPTLLPPSMFDDNTGFSFATMEDQTLFGLFDMIDMPLEDDLWPTELG